MGASVADAAAAAGAHVLQPLPYSGLLNFMLASFTAISVGRLGDVIKPLAAFPVAKIIAGILFVLVLLNFRPPAVKAIVRHPTFLALLGIFALVVCSIPVSIWPGGSVDFFKQEFAPTLVFFTVATLGYVNRRMMRTSLIAFTITVVLQALKLVLKPEFLSEGWRVYTGSLDANDSGALLVLAIPLVLYFASISKNILVKLAAPAATLLLVLALMKTGSRGGLMGLGAVALAMVAFAPPKRRSLYVVVVGLGCIVGTAAAGSSFRDRLATTFSSKEDYNYTSRDGRIEVWKRGLHYMETHPILGVGGGQFPTAEGMLSGKSDLGYGVKYSAAHNSFIQIGAELGLGGIILLAVAYAGAITGALTARYAAIKANTRFGYESPDVALTSAALCAVIGLGTCSMMISWAYVPMTWFVFAICVALYARSGPEEIKRLRKLERLAGKPAAPSQLARAGR